MPGGASVCWKSHMAPLMQPWGVLKNEQIFALTAGAGAGGTAGTAAGGEAGVVANTGRNIAPAKRCA